MSGLALSYYYYPQYRWAKRLAQLLRRYLTPATTVVDAPSGDGVISYWLLESGRFRNSFELYDRSPELIAKAAELRTVASGELTIAPCDIGAIPIGDRTADLWLLINSLYLLPDIDQLLTRMRPRFQTVVGVFPYLDRENYRRYLQFSERWDNANAMTDRQTIDFFARHGYRLDHREDATFWSQYRWSFRGSRRLLNLIDPLAAHRPGNYWLAVFSRV
jgi:hypothetical protein